MNPASVLTQMLPFARIQRNQQSTSTHPAPPRTDGITSPCSRWLKRDIFGHTSSGQTGGGDAATAQERRRPRRTTTSPRQRFRPIFVQITHKVTHRATSSRIADAMATLSCAIAPVGSCRNASRVGAACAAGGRRLAAAEWPSCRR